MCRLGQRGDTIIEVMLAFVVFGMLAIGAITVMNRGVASAQDSLETTLVRGEIDAQAETLRFMHQAYLNQPNAAVDSPSARFNEIKTTRAKNGEASQFGAATSEGKTCIDTLPDESGLFLVNPSDTEIVADGSIRAMSTSPIVATAQLDTSQTTPVGYGLWIEAVNGAVVADQPSFIDFHIRACWSSVTSNIPRTLGTIVRLYVPQT